MAVAGRNMPNRVTIVDVICERCHKLFKNMLLCFNSSNRRVCDRCLRDAVNTRNREMYPERKDYFIKYREVRKEDMKEYQKEYRKKVKVAQSLIKVISGGANAQETHPA